MIIVTVICSDIKLIDDFRQSPDIGKTKELWYVICLYYVLKTLYISHH